MEKQQNIISQYCLTFSKCTCAELLVRCTRNFEIQSMDTNNFACEYVKTKQERRNK